MRLTDLFQEIEKKTKMIRLQNLGSYGKNLKRFSKKNNIENYLRNNNFNNNKSSSVKNIRKNLNLNNTDLQNKYEIEKGIIKNPLYFKSTNNYRFGTIIKQNNSFIINNTYIKKKLAFSKKHKPFWKKYISINNSISKPEMINQKLKIRNTNMKQLSRNISSNFYKFQSSDTKLNSPLISIRNKKISTPFDSNSKRGTNIESNSFLLNSTFYSKKSPPKYSIIKEKKNNNLPTKIEKYIQILKKRKYHFIINPKYVPRAYDDGEYDDLPEEFKKVYLNHKLSAKKYNNKLLFGEFYCLLDKHKFAEKFQNPFNGPFENAKEKFYSNIKESENGKKIISQNVINITKKLIRDLSEENYKIKNKDHKKINKTKLRIKFIRNLILISKYVKYNSLNIPQVIKEYKYPDSCFKFSFTNDLITSIRRNNINACKYLLKKYKYLVLDYDYFHCTPLHWVVKYNLYELIPILMKCGAIIDEQNFLGETALHIGVKKNYYECITLLLFYLASPFIKDDNGKRPIDYNNNFQTKVLLNKIMSLHYECFLGKYSNFYENIQARFTYFINNEFCYQLCREISLFFKEKEKKFKQKF